MVAAEPVPDARRRGIAELDPSRALAVLDELGRPPPGGAHPALPRRPVRAPGRRPARPHRARHRGPARAGPIRVPPGLRRRGATMTPDPLDALRLPDRSRRPPPRVRRPPAPPDRGRRSTPPRSTDHAHRPRTPPRPPRPPRPHGVTTELKPYLIVDDAAAAIDFYVAAFGAVETMRLMQPDGRVGHAELEHRRGRLMLADEFPEYGQHRPARRAAAPRSRCTSWCPTSMPPWPPRSRPAPRSSARSPTSSTAAGAARIIDPFGHRWIGADPDRGASRSRRCSAASTS